MASVAAPGKQESNGREAQQAPIRILVAEDMRILRDTLVAVLNLEPDLEVIADQLIERYGTAS